MKKKGRKNAKKKAENIRSHRLYVRLDEEELAIFNTRKGDQNSSEFIRACILNQHIKTVYVDREKTIIKNKLSILRTELGRVGTNINQLTKIINAEHNRGTVSTKFLDVETHLLELEGVLENQKKILGNLSEFS